MNKALLSSDKMDWETPMDLFQELDREFHFTLDPCCYHRTAKCAKHYTAEDDGLSKDWSNDVVFMNPPYGREMPLWIEKAYRESLKGATVVCLIPARTDTRIYHQIIQPHARIRFLSGRVKFLQDGKPSNPAPFPSMICIFEPPMAPVVLPIDIREELRTRIRQISPYVNYALIAINVIAIANRKINKEIDELEYYLNLYDDSIYFNSYNGPQSGGSV